MMAGPLSDRFGRKQILVGMLTIFPLMMWGFILSSGVWTLPLLIVLGIFQFWVRPVMLAIVHGTNSDYPAYVNGIYMMINFVTNSVMILVMEMLSDAISLEHTFRVASTLSLYRVLLRSQITGKALVLGTIVSVSSQ
ncbi:hypothetical protein CSA56_07035 [candidate division KSB3 bacterium]|uniref:Major facilitator superfamily (MFS) profile domain-containing protein n=1 Tax=candidate division KSB3 bacterium TaxID=2044937 RepID=A0A2G6KGB2_9BACT|nr:MAG: hypothetical protein CSA56_07035 [candidate division KSB3 bacterium]